MFDEKTAIYTFYIFISSIIVIVASTLITPDIPLMFFTTLFLYFGYIYLFEDKKNYLLLTGFAAGAMILSKYTGILIIFTFLVYILLYKRKVFKERYFFYSIAIALLVFFPVLYWNYEYDFISFTFQLNHGLAKEKVFLFKEFKKFTTAQLVLFHPLYLLPLFYFIITDKKRFEKKKVYLLLPFLFTLFFFIYNSAFKHANEQWAAPAYISASVLLGYYMAKFNMKKLLISALVISSLFLIALKTPLGALYFKPIAKTQARLGEIYNFDKEIKALHLDIDSYNYILIDDYHGTEVAYYFNKYKNVLVLDNARFSNYNIWRNHDLNISLYSPIKEIPSLGKCIYIGRDKLHVQEIAKLFKSEKIIAVLKKKSVRKELTLYIVEFNN
jgi:4-amino-4-deoxy-L-arabinose transferase-like glycosyltransferase